MDKKQEKLVAYYASLSLDELYDAIGRIASKDKQQLVGLELHSKLPNFKKAGEKAFAKILDDLRSRVCPTHADLEKTAKEKNEELQVAEWTATLVDIIVTYKLSLAFPPILIAVTVGKMCNWSVKKLCKGYAGSDSSPKKGKGTASKKRK